MTQALVDMLALSDTLVPQERQLLIAHLTRRGRESQPPVAPRWSQLRGASPDFLVGEDAQSWVTRSRREAQNGRELR